MPSDHPEQERHYDRAEEQEVQRPDSTKRRYFRWRRLSQSGRHGAIRTARITRYIRHYGTAAHAPKSARESRYHALMICPLGFLPIVTIAGVWSTRSGKTGIIWCFDCGRLKVPSV